MFLKRFMPALLNRKQVAPAERLRHESETDSTLPPPTVVNPRMQKSQNICGRAGEQSDSKHLVSRWTVQTSSVEDLPPCLSDPSIWAAKARASGVLASPGDGPPSQADIVQRTLSVVHCASRAVKVECGGTDAALTCPGKESGRISSRHQVARPLPSTRGPSKHLVRVQC